MVDIFYAGEDIDTDRFKQRNDSYQTNNKKAFFKQSTERFAVELRKSHRAANLAKRRSLLGPSSAPAIFSKSFSGTINTSSLPVSLIKLYPELTDEATSEIDKLIILKNILIENPATDLTTETLETLRDILGYDNGANVEFFFTMGFTELLLKYMDWKYGSCYVYPATICVANLTTCDHYYVNSLVSMRGIDQMVNVFGSKSLKTSGLVLTALGNIILDDKNYLKLVVNKEVFNAINKLLEESKEFNIDLLRSLAFYLHAVTMKCSDLTTEHVIQIERWIEGITDTNDPGIEKDLIISIYEITRNHCNDLKSKQIMRFLIEHNTDEYSLRAISNICACSNENSDFFFQQYFIEKLHKNVIGQTSRIRKVSYQCLHNILTSCTSVEVNNNFKCHLIDGLTDSDVSVREECCYLLANTSSHFEFELWSKLLDNGLIKGLELCLESELKPSIVNNALYICSFMLLSGKTEMEERQTLNNRYVDLFETSECIKLLEILASHENTEISDFAQELIDEYFESYTKSEEYISQSVVVFSFS